MKQKRPMVKTTCKECGEEFERRKDNINRYKNNYCSPKCANKVNARNRKGKSFQQNRTGKEIKCKFCEKKFYVSGSRLKNGAKYCSLSCANKDKPKKGFISKIDNSGKNNPRYKHGKRVGEHVSKKKVRGSVIERDGNWCLICGKPPKGLHLHRVVYGSQGGKYEKGNCVQLCAEHHETIHMNKTKWMPALKEYIEIATKESDGNEPETQPSYQVEWRSKLNEH